MTGESPNIFGGGGDGFGFECGIVLCDGPVDVVDGG